MWSEYLLQHVTGARTKRNCLIFSAKHPPSKVFDVSINLPSRAKEMVFICWHVHNSWSISHVFIDCSNATCAKSYVSRIVSFRFTAISSVQHSKSGLYSQIVWPELDTSVLWYVDRLECSVSVSLTKVRWHIASCTLLLSTSYSQWIILILSWRIRKYACTHCFRECYRHPDVSIQHCWNPAWTPCIPISSTFHIICDLNRWHILDWWRTRVRVGLVNTLKQSTTS